MSIIQPSRRRFLFGAASLVAAPAIVRVASLMPSSAKGLAHLRGETVAALAEWHEMVRSVGFNLSHALNVGDVIWVKKRMYRIVMSVTADA